MTYQVQIQTFKDLSEAEKEAVPNNGSGREYANYLRVTHKGRTLFLESDASEPEDASFSRDLSWIVGALRQAYELGLLDEADVTK